MATPQVSTTTFQGRLCTRTRVRTASTAAPSTTEVAAAVIERPPETSTSTTTPSPPPQTTSQAQPPQDVQTTSSASTPAPASASTATTASAADPETSSTLSSVVPTTSQSTTARRPALAPSPAVAVAPNVVEPSDAALVPSNQETPSISTGNAEAATEAAPTPTLVDSSDPVTSVITSISPGADGFPNSPSSPTSPTNQLTDDNPQQTNGPNLGSGGMISPEKGPGGGVGGASLTDAPRANVGGIVGGVMGGFVGIALAGAILFLCLRRRKRSTAWDRQLNEKNDSNASFIIAKIKNVISGGNATMAGVFARLRGDKSEEVRNHPYRRQSARSSISSVYSTNALTRPRSTSEPPWRIREQLRGFGDRMPSLKRSRTLLGKRKDSLVTGSKSPFPAFVEDPLVRNSKNPENPFADPPLPRRSIVEGLQDQQRPPITPRTPRQPPAVASERGSVDPFASILDELGERERSGTPDWLRDGSHKRTQSFTNGLRSHPPSSIYTASVYTTAAIDPFLDPDAPPVPTQPLPPDPPQRPTNAFTGVGGAYVQASFNNRESNNSLSFGEPGPSRPTSTNRPTAQMYSVAMAPRPMGRQSDPFDLDRPEVLGFGNVQGRREVRASVTRQNSKNNRTSSVPNFGTLDDWSDRKRQRG